MLCRILSPDGMFQVMYGVKDGCIQGIHDPEVTQGPGEMLKTNCCIDQIRTFLISTSARDTGPWRAGGAICKYAARPEMIYVLKFRFEVKSPNTHENSSSFHTTMRKRTGLCDFSQVLPPSFQIINLNYNSQSQY